MDNLVRYQLLAAVRQSLDRIYQAEEYQESPFLDFGCFAKTKTQSGRFRNESHSIESSTKCNPPNWMMTCKIIPQSLPNHT